MFTDTLPKLCDINSFESKVVILIEDTNITLVALAANFSLQLCSLFAIADLYTAATCPSDSEN